MRVALLLCVLLSALTGCGGSGDGGAPASSAPPDPVIDAAGYEDIRTTLQAAGWACFDTIQEPSPVRRCYLDALAGDPAGTVTFRFFDPDFISYLNVYLDGVDPVALGAVRDVVATSIGDELLEGAGADLVNAVQAGQPTQVAGVRLELRDPTHFEVIDPSYQEVPHETDILSGLAELDKVVPQLEQRGFSCVEVEGPPGSVSRLTECEGSVRDLSMRLTVLADGYDTNEWQGGAIAVPGRSCRLVPGGRDSGVRAAAVLRGGLRPQGLNADVEGHHVSVSPFQASVTVDRRLASEINS